MEICILAKEAVYEYYVSGTSEAALYTICDSRLEAFKARLLKRTFLGGTDLGNKGTEAPFP